VCAAIFSMRLFYLGLTLFLICVWFDVVDGYEYGASSGLVAYYPFENSPIPQSGVCPFPPYLLNPVAQGAGVLSYVNNTYKTGGFEKALWINNNKPYLRTLTFYS